MKGKMVNTNKHAQGYPTRGRLPHSDQPPAAAQLDQSIDPVMPATAFRKDPTVPTKMTIWMRAGSLLSP
jgi:hypothetical protein